MADLTIGEAARRAGVAASALRYYEEAGVLPPARRVGGQRRYDEDLVDLIQVARFARSVGFSLAEIRSLFNAGSNHRLDSRWRPLARAKMKELDAIMSKARQMKAAIELGLACGCIRVEDCLPRNRARRKAKRR